jgi:hypothetical protein
MYLNRKEEVRTDRLNKFQPLLSNQTPSLKIEICLSRITELEHRNDCLEECREIISRMRSARRKKGKKRKEKKTSTVFIHTELY